MSTSEPRPGAARFGPARVIAVIVAALIALVGFTAATGGGVLVWAHQTQRDADGYYTTSAEHFATTTYALTARVDLGQAPGEHDWTITHPVGTVRIRTTSTGGEPLFVGIGPTADVEQWLAGVSHEQVTGANFGPFRTTSDVIAGTTVPALPTDLRFWAATATGTGTTTLLWPSEQGQWTIVVTNTDARPGVAADISAGAKTGVLLPIGIGMLAGGVVFLVGAGLMTFLVLRRRATPALPAGTATAVPGSYPVRLNGHLDHGLSRWLWLVKFVLVIPHAIVLALLWLALTVTTVFAGIAILFTGRYPRSIFDFNVGVMRWTWRVSFYATSAFATDRYPAFSLRSDPTYPADLSIDYPEHLSRGLVLVKWWLLAIPHYLIVAFFSGGFGVGWNGAWRIAGGGGLITILAVVGAFMLAVRGEYPDSIFDVVMAMNRWCFRVLAYAALMTDEYPPFRFDTGGIDPGSMLPPPAPPAAGPWAPPVDVYTDSPN